MKFLDYVQGTPEWLAWRRTVLGASDAVVISGAAVPWPDPVSPRRLWELKTGRAPEPESTFAMRRGSRLEPRARQLYQERTGHRVEPACVVHDAIPWLATSLDGIDAWGEVICEVKAPRRESHEEALAGRVPAYYVPQLLHQALVTGLDRIDYVSISENKAFAEKDLLAIVEWRPDVAELRRLLEALAAFWMRVCFNYWPEAEAA